MSYPAELKKAIGHGHAGPPDSFLDTVIAWLKTEDDSVFTENANADIFTIVKQELGPFTSLNHRKAVLGWVMVIMAGDESDFNWHEGRDVSAGPQREEQKEAGALQPSYDSINLGPGLKEYLAAHGVHSALEFQACLKGDPMLQLGYVGRLLRLDYKHWDGPINRGWVEAQVKREAVAALQALL